MARETYPKSTQMKTCDRTKQTPNAEAARIGMALLQVIHVDHERQPGLPRGRFGRPALILQPSPVLRFKAPYPAIDRRPGDLQKPADTALTPALRVQLNDLAAGVRAIRLAVIGAQGQLALGRHRTLLPELFDGLIIEDVSEVLVCYSLGVYETQSNPQATRVIV